MRQMLISSLGVALLLAFSGCKGNSDSMGSMAPAPATMPATMPGAMMYTCPMHPEVASSTPGKCPKCAMALVEKK